MTDVKKTYGSVEVAGIEMMAGHRFLDWVGKMVSRLYATWNVVTTKLEWETSGIDQVQQGSATGGCIVSIVPKAVYDVPYPRSVATQSLRGLQTVQADLC